MGEKRQRVDSGATATVEADDDLAALLAQATATATQAVEMAAEQGQVHDEPSRFLSQDAEEEETTLFISDPHLSMRILSLPILDSLVRGSILSQL
jgi:hypothetical protein